MKEKNKLFNQADWVVTKFTTKKMKDSYKKLQEAQEEGESAEVLIGLVKTVNSWIAFLDLADTYPRFKVVSKTSGKAEVEIFYN
ncbi:MAG: hypothetical protein OEX81_01970 [Candidatus Pacebacteria bacterium]|nr:hypothetical protein [Candidatus Paceibacterota bacterium]